MSVATITTSDNQSKTFEVFQTDAGRIEDQAVTVEEELTASGVDGRRWRTVSNRYRYFTATTITSCTDYAAAINAARFFDACVGTICKLSVSLAGVSYNYNRVHVSECKAFARPGYLSGSGITASNAAYVSAVWTFAVMDVPSGSVP